MSTSILLRGPLLTNSGYGVHARQVARWLFDNQDEYDLDISTEPLRWGGTGWITDITAEDGLIAQIVQNSENKKPFYDFTIQIQLPNEWNPLLGAFNIGITAGVETDKCNPAWIESINKMNLVITPSEFTKKTFLDSGNVLTDISVVPESFIDEIQNPESCSIDLSGLSTDFNFLVFGQLTGTSVETDRKNILFTIKWLAETFANRKDIGVVLKTNFVRNTKMDRKAVTRFVSALVASVQQGNGPRIHLLHGDLSKSEIAGLYRNPKIKALVSLTHGEGFGIPLLEAAASGLPVIATSWSGHMDFLSKGKFLGVSHTVEPVHQSKIDGNIFVPGAKWAYPSEKDAKFRFAKFAESPTIPQQWAKELRSTLLETHSFQAISQKYDEVIGRKLKDFKEENNDEWDESWEDEDDNDQD